MLDVTMSYVPDLGLAKGALPSWDAIRAFFTDFAP
jgi:hypothetical protein